MMNIRFWSGVAVAIGLLCAVFIPDWFEDPVKLAIGEWQGYPNKVRAEVDEQQVRWYAGGHRGKFTYTWLQTDTEPYRVQFSRGEESFEADVIFEGDEEAILLPLVMDRMPEIARDYIRRQNKARNRPEDELRFLFRRVKEKAEK